MFSLTSMVTYSSSKPKFLNLQKTSFVAKILSYTHSETVPPTERKADNWHYEACFTGDSSEWVLKLLDNKKCTGVRHHQEIPSFGWNRERTPCRQSEEETICTWTISLLVIYWVSTMWFWVTLSEQVFTEAIYGHKGLYGTSLPWLCSIIRYQEKFILSFFLLLT